MARHNQNTERMLRAIRVSGYLTSLDLKAETGIPEKNQRALLTRAIDTGRVVVEKARLPGRRACNGYRWVGDRSPPPAGAAPDPKGRALRTCLFALEEHDLRGPLRAGAGDDDLAERVQAAVATKWAGHRIGQPVFVRPGRSMSQIGG